VTRNAKIHGKRFRISKTPKGFYCIVLPVKKTKTNFAKSAQITPEVEYLRSKLICFWGGKLRRGVPWAPRFSRLWRSTMSTPVY